MKSLARGITVEICPFRDGHSAPSCAEYDGSLGVITIFKGNSDGLSAVVEVKTGARKGEKPLIPALCLVPLSRNAAP